MGMHSYGIKEYVIEINDENMTKLGVSDEWNALKSAFGTNREIYDAIQELDHHERDCPEKRFSQAVYEELGVGFDVYHLNDECDGLQNVDYDKLYISFYEDDLFTKVPKKLMSRLQKDEIGPQLATWTVSL